MNGKKAKRFRKAARALLIKSGENPNDGYKSYNQAMNCQTMGYAYNEDGTIMKDPDGNRLLTSKKNPGTIRHDHKERIIYKYLKKNSKKGN